MRTRRLLLAASALSTLTFGCTKDKPVQKTDEGTTEPLPGNPKGAFYDDAMVTPPQPDPVAEDAAVRRPSDAALPRDAALDGPRDAGVPRDATPDGPRDAGAPRDAPRDAPRRRPDAQLYTNPKGSFYDKGLDPLD